MQSTKSSRPKTRALFSAVAICFFIALGIIHGPQTASIATDTTNNEAPRQIAPGQSMRFDLAAADKDVFSISVEQGKLLRFSIDKDDLALSAILYDPAGARLLEHVSQDFEVVDLSYPVQFTGTYRIELQSRERTALSRSYEIKVYDLKTATDLDRKDSEARQAVAHAEVLRADWTETSLRQAIAEYDKAATIWTSVSDFANASQAALRAGDSYFRVSEYTEALKRYQNAEKLGAGDWLAKARALSRMARLQTFLANNDLAQKHATKALDLCEQHGANRNAIATNVCGEVLSSLAEVTYAKGNLLKSSQQFESARQLLQNDRKGEARTHLFSGYIAGGLGNPEKAVAEVTRALELYRAINHRAGEGLALTALGLSRSLKRDENGAIKLHNEAIEIFSAVGDRHSHAIALNGLGQAYENLSEFSIALVNYNNADQLARDSGAIDVETVTSFKIGKVYFLTKQLDQALEYFERCLSLSRAAGKVRTEANALLEIAKIYAAQGRNELASNRIRRVQAFYQGSGDRRGQAAALNAYGGFLLQLGKKQEALDFFRRALPLSEKAGDKGHLLTTLYNLARANAELGSLDVALKWIQQSLEVIEDRRTNVASPEFRASYFSGVRNHYELCIEILMQLDHERPGDGFAAEALSMSDKSRARLLLDLLSESQTGLRDGASAELLKRERELRGSARSLAQYEMELSLAKRNSSELMEVSKQLAELRSEYQDIQARLRERRPDHLAALEQFEPARLDQIKKELGGTETLLLQYSLGEKQSYLWAVTADSFSSFTLPPRKYIEDKAVEFYKLVTTRQGSDGQSDKDYQAQLSQILLGPVVEQLGNKRVVVVAEGALHYIPFEALPVIGANNSQDGRPRMLIETNEVDYLPSISTLTAIRAEKNASHSSNKVVAVIADPVFSRSDDRVQSEPSSASASAASNQPDNTSVAQVFRDVTGNNGPPRLLHSAEEADAISAAAPRGTTMVVEGFDATRETAMSPQIGEYQIVHIATHGFFYTKHPELSGIVLTMVDRAGVEKNGLMPLDDIYSLDLSAELTVLSACQTALGKDVNGEGLVGLTHSFMSAGSKTVVASLWKVDDRATANLMADFYHAMLQEGMPTGAALRAAKLKMMQDKRWNAPYFWAGFVLQGEYTNQIAVDRSSPFSIRTVLLLLIVPGLAGLMILYWRRRRLAGAPRV